MQMKVTTEYLQFHTESRFKLINITKQVEKILKDRDKRGIMPRKCNAYFF